MSNLGPTIRMSNAHGPCEPGKLELRASLVDITALAYPASVYAGVQELQQQIATAPTTVLLLPSVDLEACVAETVRRQASRPLAIHRPAAREEEVIRQRFAQYRKLGSRVVTTMQPVETVALEIALIVTMSAIGRGVA